MIFSVDQFKNDDYRRSMLQFEFEKVKHNIINEMSDNSDDVMIYINDDNEIIDNPRMRDIIENNLNTLYNHIDKIYTPTNNMWFLPACVTRCFQ